MGDQGHSQDNKFVTEDHFEQVILRVEGKVDRLTDVLEPKVDMIVRIDTSFKWLKGIAVFVFSGGFLAIAYKAIHYFQSLAKK